MAVGGLAILLVGQAVRADTMRFGSHRAPQAVSRHGGIGIWIGAPAPRFLPPMPGRILVPVPRHHHPRPVCIVPARREVPVVRPRVEARTITMWVTNSNGSRTSVQLTRQGPWYVGPRGEYYADMPTNEQLRIVYGF